MDVFPSSPEADIDRQLEELIGKMVNQEATPEDLVAYQELQERRAKLMTPIVPHRWGGRGRFRTTRLLKRA